MTYQVCPGYDVDGTSALKIPARAHLRVIEGGAQHSKKMSNARVSELAPRQVSRPEAATAIVSILFCLVLVFAAWGFSHVEAAQAYAAATSDVQEKLMTVAAGDTLLGISGNHPIDNLDARQTAHWISERNGLDTSMLTPGQQLVVPR